jgi:hypothetical protein
MYVETWQDAVKPDSYLQTPASPVTIVVEASKTPTIPVCEAFAIEVGDVCRYEFTPTPLASCPAKSDGGYCIYDGPLSLRARKTPTPTQSGPGLYPGGNLSGTPIPGDTGH